MRLIYVKYLIKYETFYTGIKNLKHRFVEQG